MGDDDRLDRAEDIEAPRPLSVSGALDRALSLQSSLVDRNLQRARRARPDASPAEVISALERMYRGALAGTGAAVGGSAAVPGVGTTVALALSGGELATSLQLTTLFALSVAEVHGVRIDELERRRTLVMGLALGSSGSETIGRIAERTGQHWAKQVVASVPAAKLKSINNVLGRHFITKYGTKQGIIVLGRVVPFGVGAAIGASANLVLAETTIRASRRAFGPAPQTWPAGTIGKSPHHPLQNVSDDDPR